MLSLVNALVAVHAFSLNRGELTLLRVRPANSSGGPTQISFRDFGTANNARIQAFHSFGSGPEEEFAPDLGLLTSLVADGSLKPQIGAEPSRRDLNQTLDELRDRHIAGKAVFRIE
jgi:hypothetical protein